MPVPEKQKGYSKKYIQEKLDEIKLRVPKGQKALIQAHADQTGESVNAFIYRAITEAMDRDSAGAPKTTGTE